jgi:peroxiredoxin
MIVSMATLTELPSDLPQPLDDGAADHLLGMKLPRLTLQATTGAEIHVGAIPGLLVVYCYPMTGQPNVALPEGWDQIPGARGCTPQSCSFRDHYQEIQDLGAAVMGLSVQSTEYQTEMAQRLHLPFPVLSDADYSFQQALRLPTFQAAGMTLLKRLTLIAKDGLIVAVHYPVFPSDSDPQWVIEQLKSLTTGH